MNFKENDDINSCVYRTHEGNEISTQVDIGWQEIYPNFTARNYKKASGEKKQLKSIREKCHRINSEVFIPTLPEPTSTVKNQNARSKTNRSSLIKLPKRRSYSNLPIQNALDKGILNLKSVGLLKIKEFTLAQPNQFQQFMSLDSKKILTRHHTSSTINEYNLNTRSTKQLKVFKKSCDYKNKRLLKYKDLINSPKKLTPAKTSINGKLNIVELIIPARVLKYKKKAKQSL